MERYRRIVRECAAGVGSRGRNLCVDSDFAAVLAVEMRELRVDPGTSGVVNEVCKYLERRRRFWENMGCGVRCSDSYAINFVSTSSLLKLSYSVVHIYLVRGCLNPASRLPLTQVSANLLETIIHLTE